ncbi:ABC transporter permease [Campylobacter sp. CN_NE4]|uniref:MlaE family ABC transporter permease n=1 Tax=unclassified Campylobacter TaxID=2593542 RepID=UPI0022E9BAB7|nr:MULTISPECIES: ABC transporter permease [unclassified Campylobacter]MDA3066083.1 ABC transporter permease [Campylobacter sp. CN_NE4]MDA3069056.1 ABC transporter permease [Campylobacter sp. CN_NE3]
MANSPFSVLQNGDETTIYLNGDWTYKLKQAHFNELKKNIQNARNINLNFSNLSDLDYFAAVLLKKSLNGKIYKFSDESRKVKTIFEFINDENIDFKDIPQKNSENIFSQIGRSVVLGISNLLNLATFLGEFVIKFFQMLLHPSKIRFKEVVNFAKDSGIDALFIVGLTAFLIGVVLAYIGSDMLSQFGASIYIIDIMGTLTLREIAPLIAAIVVAGRTSSSFTAQIGVMKITEEIDAMKTMGFDPFYFLSMPRILAMILIMPFVICIADLISILAQMIVCNAYLDILFSDYLTRFKEAVELRHFFVGLIKAPFFGAIIALIGCMRGFEVQGNTQSIGIYTTISVVNAIFWVIAIDAIFAVTFSELGI